MTTNHPRSSAILAGVASLGIVIAVATVASGAASSASKDSDDVSSYNVAVDEVANCIRTAGLRVATFENSLGYNEYVVELGRSYEPDAVDECEDAGEIYELAQLLPPPERADIEACLDGIGLSTSIYELVLEDSATLSHLVESGRVNADAIFCFGVARPLSPDQLVFTGL